MAVDDITTVITANSAQGDTTDRQPSAGVEEVLLAQSDVNSNGTAPERAPSVNLNIIDGTNNDARAWEMSTTAGSLYVPFHLKHAANNTNYFRITHSGATTGDYGFVVIEQG